MGLFGYKTSVIIVIIIKYYKIKGKQLNILKPLQILLMLFALEQIASAGFFSSFFGTNATLIHSPKSNAKDVSPDIVIKLSYGEDIYHSSLSTNNIQLTQLSSGEKIKGTVSYNSANKTISFKPTSLLQRGKYHILYKDILRRGKAFFFFRFYTLKSVEFDFEVTQAIKKLELDKPSIGISLTESETIHVQALYEDNTTKDVTQDVEWLLGDNSIVSIDKNLITPLKEGTTTLQAKYSNKTTPSIAVNVYTKIDDFILPPEPDETLNNSTLLGIDSNHNGIRDDIERWILLDKEIYYGNAKIERSIAFEKARAFQMTLADPTNRDDIVHQAMTDASDCRSYYIYVKNRDREEYDGKENRNLKDKIFNTRERFKTYWKYDGTLGGRVFTSTYRRLLHTKCPQDIYNLIEGQ